MRSGCTSAGARRPDIAAVAEHLFVEMDSVVSRLAKGGTSAGGAALNRRRKCLVIGFGFGSATEGDLLFRGKNFLTRRLLWIGLVIRRFECRWIGGARLFRRSAALAG